MSEIFHVDANKRVHYRSLRNAKYQQRYCFDRRHPDTGQPERMGDEYYYNNHEGTFDALSEPTDWTLTIENDQGASSWRESKVRKEADGPSGWRYWSGDSMQEGTDKEDWNDLIVEVSFF